MKNVDKICNWLWALTSGALMVCLITLLFFGTAKTEVEVYSVGCEITQMAYAEETVSRMSSRPVYKMGVRNDEFAATIDISSSQFAMFSVGDVVEVEVTVWEYMSGGIEYEYKLLGAVIE